MDPKRRKVRETGEEIGRVIKRELGQKEEDKK